MDTNIKKPSFWQRQINSEITLRQIVFDVLFGIVAPILAIVFDPIVFRGDMAVLGRYQMVAYVAIALGTLALAMWLLFRSHLSQWSSLFGGIFLIGALFALVLGLVLLPLSVIGLQILLGLLGFIPFATAYVFYRNCRRALRLAQSSISRPRLVGLFSLGALLVVAIPIIVQVATTNYVSQSIDELLNGDPATVENAVLKMNAAFWCSDLCYTDILLDYQRTNSVRQEILARAYHDITGQDIRSALFRLGSSGSD
jgi:MFS family permease